MSVHPQTMRCTGNFVILISYNLAFFYYMAFLVLGQLLRLENLNDLGRGHRGILLVTATNKYFMKN